MKDVEVCPRCNKKSVRARKDGSLFCLACGHDTRTVGPCGNGVKKYNNKKLEALGYRVIEYLLDHDNADKASVANGVGVSIEAAKEQLRLLVLYKYCTIKTVYVYGVVDAKREELESLLLYEGE